MLYTSYGWGAFARAHLHTPFPYLGNRCTVAVSPGLARHGPKNVFSGTGKKPMSKCSKMAILHCHGQRFGMKQIIRYENLPQISTSESRRPDQLSGHFPAASLKQKIMQTLRLKCLLRASERSERSEFFRI